MPKSTRNILSNIRIIILFHLQSSYLTVSCSLINYDISNRKQYYFFTFVLNGYSFKSKICLLLHYTVRPNKNGNTFYQWDIFIATQELIKLYASLSRAFSLLSFATKHMMISQCMTEKKRFKLMHVKIDLRRIIVLSWYDQVQTSKSMSE